VPQALQNKNSQAAQMTSKFTHTGACPHINSRTKIIVTVRITVAILQRYLQRGLLQLIVQGHGLQKRNSDTFQRRGQSKHADACTQSRVQTQTSSSINWRASASELSSLSSAGSLVVAVGAAVGAAGAEGALLGAATT
jgi:hypothetical protein